MSKRVALAILWLLPAAAASGGESRPSIVGSNDGAPRLGTPPVASVADARPRLQLVFFDVSNAAPFAYREMTAETERVLDQLGVDVGWTRGVAGETTTGPGEVKVVLLNRAPEPKALAPRVMGAVLRKSEPPGQLWIYFPNVAWALGHAIDVGRPWTPRQRSEIATALARVVAHELLHLVLPEIPHSRHGLMAERTGRNELLDERARINPEFREAFVARLRGLGPAPAVAAASPE